MITQYKPYMGKKAFTEDVLLCLYFQGGRLPILPELDRSKHRHVIENGHCNICELPV